MTASPDENAPRQHRHTSDPYEPHRILAIDAVTQRQANLEVAPGDRSESIHGPEAEILDQRDASLIDNCDLGSVETAGGPGNPVAGRGSSQPGSG